MEAKSITCECAVTAAQRRLGRTQTCQCDARQYPTCENCCGFYVRMYEKTGALSGGASGATGFDPGLASGVYSGQLEGPRLPGASIGLKHPATGRVVASAAVAENGSFRVPLPPPGSPPPPYQVCLAARTPRGVEEFCGPVGETSPAVAVPGGTMRVRHATAKNAIGNAR
jgi:hypothetical protein